MESRALMAVLAVLLVLAGCASQQHGTISQQTKEIILNQSGNLSAGTDTYALITSTQQNGVSIVRMQASERSGRFVFPHTDYDSPFSFAGLESDSFIRLNRSHIAWLGENESIWLTLMQRNGSGVLFNAIYSQDIAECGRSGVPILGKSYPLSALKNGSSFENDDKWKVVLRNESGCLKQAIIYLDGYFDNIRDGEQISLFRNDNTILLEFDSLGTEPSSKVIATKPPLAIEETAGEESETIARNNYTIGGNSTSSMADDAIYDERESIGPGGISIVFEPALPMFIKDSNWGPDYSFDDLRENGFFVIYVNHTPWDLVRLRANKSVFSSEQKSEDGEYREFNSTEGNDELIIGKATPILVNQCENITVGNETFAVKIGVGKILLTKDTGNCTEWHSVPFEDDEGIVISEDESLRQVDGKWVQLQLAAPIDASWAQIRIFDQIVNLSGDESVSLLWAQEAANASRHDCDAITCRDYNVTFQNPALKSIYIPRSSPIFQKLTG